MEVTLFTPDIIPSDQPCWLPWMSKSFFFFLECYALLQAFSGANLPLAEAISYPHPTASVSQENSMVHLQLMHHQGHACETSFK